MLDPRIVRIGIEVKGVIRYYSDLAISASGTKYANATENECEVKITNLSKETREYLLTETSPFLKPHYDKTPAIPKDSKKSTTKPTDGAAEVISGVRMILEAGRVSTGTAIVFIGDIISARVSQPPDIDIVIKAATKSDAKGDVISRSKADTTDLSKIAKDVAKDLGLSLLFEAKDKKIANYSFTGASIKQVERLANAGGVNAFIDDDKLIVKDNNVAINGKSRTLNLETGMIGIPEITEHGIKVKCLYDNDTQIGTALIIKSKLNPSASGTYIVYKLGFDIANRDNPFYLVLEAKRA